MSAELMGELVFPPEWKLGKPWGPGFPTIMLTGDEGKVIAAGGVLKDGTNLMGLCWPGGQRVCRISPDTGWAIEERFGDGDPPPESVVKVWRIIIDSFVAGLRDAEQEWGGRP